MRHVLSTIMILPAILGVGCKTASDGGGAALANDTHSLEVSAEITEEYVERVAHMLREANCVERVIVSADENMLGGPNGRHPASRLTVQVMSNSGVRQCVELLTKQVPGLVLIDPTAFNSRFVPFVIERDPTGAFASGKIAQALYWQQSSAAVRNRSTIHNGINYCDQNSFTDEFRCIGAILSRRAGLVTLDEHASSYFYLLGESFMLASAGEDPIPGLSLRRVSTMRWMMIDSESRQTMECFRRGDMSVICKVRGLR